MYLPDSFREAGLHEQHALIRTHPLGLLISLADGAPVANPIPFLLDASVGERGLLRAHLARANPQWRALKQTPDALIVFQGADAYVTPSWYATKRETGKVVPTWNYAIVQARGKIRVIEDAGWLSAQVGALTDAHEAARAMPWAVTDAPEPYIARQLKGIVGLEMEITTLDGKWKVSQNRSEADRAGVAAGLDASDDPRARDVAAMVRATP
jgi:transcriptional regulator